EVSRVTPFGAFVKLSDDINGLIHVSEITGDENGNAEEVLQVGEKVKAKVIAIEPEEHRVGLSIKALDEEGEEKPKKKSAKKEVEEDEDEEKEEKPKKA